MLVNWEVIINIISKTIELSKKEKEYTLKLLKCLVQIDTRRLYAELGYSSLYEFVRDHLGYTDGETATRVNAARLMRSSKKIEIKMDKKEITLTQAALIHSNFKNESTEIKERIADLSTGKSKRETQRIIQNETSPAKTKTLRLGANLCQLFEKVQKNLDGASDYETLKYLLEKELGEINPKRAGKLRGKERYIPLSVKRKLLDRSGHRCEYKTAVGVRCRARSNLQFDHIIPIYRGGESHYPNLQILCSAHNLAKGVSVVDES